MASTGKRTGGEGTDAPSPTGHARRARSKSDRKRHEHDGHEHHEPAQLEAHAHGEHAHGEHAHGEHAHEDHHDHAHGLRQTPLQRLVAAFVVTALFMIVEAGVGFWSRSLALLADAGHMLADAAALALAIVAQKIASQERTRARTYGYRRAEVLAAFANGIALALTAIWIFIEAVERIQEPPTIRGGAMTATAVAGLLVNIGAAVMLGAGAHGHNVNTRAALAHVLTDALGSVGAIVAGVLVFGYGWYRADPVISAVIGVLVLWGGWRLVRDTSRVLMEGSPVEIDIAHVEETLRSVPGVRDFHDLHVWSISEGFHVLTVHIVLEKGQHGIEVVEAASRRLRRVHGLDHCTIQPERYEPEERLVTIRKRRPEGA